MPSLLIWLVKLLFVIGITSGNPSTNNERRSIVNKFVDRIKRFSYSLRSKSRNIPQNTNENNSSSYEVTKLEPTSHKITKFNTSYNSTNTSIFIPNYHPKPRRKHSDPIPIPKPTSKTKEKTQYESNNILTNQFNEIEKLIPILASVLFLEGNINIIDDYNILNIGIEYPKIKVKHYTFSEGLESKSIFVKIFNMSNNTQICKFLCFDKKYFTPKWISINNGIKIDFDIITFENMEKYDNIVMLSTSVITSDMKDNGLSLKDIMFSRIQNSNIMKTYKGFLDRFSLEVVSRLKFSTNSHTRREYIARTANENLPKVTKRGYVRNQKLSNLKSNSTIS